MSVNVFVYIPHPISGKSENFTGIDVLLLYCMCLFNSPNELSHFTAIQITRADAIRNAFN